MKEKTTQFGYIHLFGRYWDVDPVGRLISKTEDVVAKIMGYRGYHHERWHQWDNFYRCKLGVQDRIYRWQRQKALTTMRFEGHENNKVI